MEAENKGAEAGGKPDAHRAEKADLQESATAAAPPEAAPPAPTLRAAAAERAAPPVSPPSGVPPASPATAAPPASPATMAPLSTPAVAAPMAAPQLHIAPRPHQPDLEALPDADAERRIRAMSRRGFLWGAAAVAGTVGGIGWLATRRADNGIQWPLRRLLEVNENLSRDFFSGQRLAPEFDKAAAETPRPNGDYGVADEVDPDWSLRLVGLADMSAAQVPDTGSSAPTDSEAPAKGGVPPSPADKKTGRTAVAPAGDAASDTSDESESAETTPPQLEPAVVVTMKEIRALPKTDIVTELKCIEGWSTVVHWTGVRLADFLQKYAPATRSGQPFDLRHPEDMPDYVSMETPDGAYYVGLDMASALHPQTLLCYEMNGKPLTAEHGAPLRLAIPVKYGIKNIKNIGKIKFTDERPRDYWAERGYDWYAGH